jgi:predicted PurR-regulated permease PerM
MPTRSKIYEPDSPIDTVHWANRPNGKQVVLVGVTLLALVMSVLLVWPFLSALTWAVTVAVVTHGAWGWLHKKVRRPSVAAGIAVVAVALTVLLPVIFLLYLAATEILETARDWQQQSLVSWLNEQLAGHPRLEALWKRLEQNIDFTAVVQQIGQGVQSIGTVIVSGIAYTAFQAALMLFVLYYLYRDEQQAREALWRFSPLTTAETERMLSRINDTIHATIYGSMVVAVVQGALGSFIFWILGVPGAAVWGVAMGLLAMVPYMGTFMIWAPTAAILALGGHWTKASILVAWGVLVIGLVDNLLYPTLVGGRLRQHTVVSFLAILGGISLFGASGIILGPVLVSATFVLLEIWRERSVAAPA